MKEIKDRRNQKNFKIKALLLTCLAVCTLLYIVYSNFVNMVGSKISHNHEDGSGSFSAGITDSNIPLGTDRYTLMEAAAPVIIQDTEFNILHIDTKLMNNVQTVYVIPGGGNNPTDEGGGYPEWTKRRVVAAVKHYNQYYGKGSPAAVNPETASPRAIFLALSAGSLNSPNLLSADRRIIFECQHIINHLRLLDVPKNIIFGDTFSWDTITNAMTLRMTVEAIQAYRISNDLNFSPDPLAAASVAVQSDSNAVKGVPTNLRDKSPKSAPTEVAAAAAAAVVVKEGAEGIVGDAKVFRPLAIEVFISDFHLSRMQAAMAWVLRLAPAVQGVSLRMNSVDSVGINWRTPLDFSHRIAHEEAGEKRIRDNEKSIQTLAQFQAFLLLGGHQGLHKYVHEEYQRSVGGGW
jgi:hypothetical protein